MLNTASIVNVLSQWRLPVVLRLQLNHLLLLPATEASYEIAASVDGVASVSPGLLSRHVFLTEVATFPPNLAMIDQVVEKWQQLFAI